MNTSKSNSYGKLLVFFLIAVILVFAFGFVADGWQSDTEPEPDSGDNDNNDNNTDKADENTDGQENESKEPEVYIPTYVNNLTGLEVTEEDSKKRHTCFVMSSSAALYGISSADLIAEIPIENGSTRLVAFMSDSSVLGKIGSIEPTRGYISNIAKNFGASLISYGNDDTKIYASADISASHFDLTKYTGYHYTEYTQFVYTNGDLINAGLSNSGIASASSAKPMLPYVFTDFGAEAVVGTDNAKTVIIPYADGAETELYYSAADGLYTFAKSGTVKHDMLNDKTVKFQNVFILFADTVTYETKDGSQMIMNTVGSGSGYYITGGTAINITWSATESGSVSFYDELGERLTVNRGSFYIGYVKSSLTDEVKLS